jgi:ABC-type antimicrobial peptide transport system permease subunit
MAQLERDVSPPLMARVKKEPHLKKIIPSVPYLFSIKTVFGELPCPVYGVDPAAMTELITLSGNKVAEGRLPQPGEPEIVLSRTWVNNLGTKLGKTITFSDEKFPTITEPQKVVGILEGGTNLALSDIDFVVDSFPNPQMIRQAHLLIPDAHRNLSVLNKNIDDFIKNPKKYGLDRRQVRYAKFFTHEDMVKEIRKGLGYFFNFLAIADALVIGAVALLSGFLANIYFESRLGEFGLLSAFGFRREKLAGRLVVETGALVVVSWLCGLALTWIIMRLLDTYYMTPRGLILAEINRLAMLYTLPTPILVGVASLGTVLYRLYKLDPIEIMERR